MNKRILLGVDTTLSRATQHALRTFSELIEQSPPSLHIILLNVIPVAYMASPSMGLYMGQLQPLSATPEQHATAKNVLLRASAELQNQGVSQKQIETLIRQGIPADEIVKVARELQVDLIVIGGRGVSLKQQIRRFFMGSTSHRVSQLAPCPVMIVIPPQTRRPTDLVKWYEEAITHYLHEHTSDLAVLTPREVAQMFAPPQKRAPGRKETAAATLALEQLARSGVLCRHDVKGEMRYVND
jgi:nucleotide-binding universal stress UspA family protein